MKDMWIRNLITGETIELFSPPEGLNVSRQVAWKEEMIPGQTFSIRGYCGTEPESGTLAFMVHADQLTLEKDDEKFERYLNKVRALANPDYSAGINPPRMLINVANIKSFVAVCGSVSIDYMFPMRDGKYILAKVSIDYSDASGISRSASEVEGGLL